MKQDECAQLALPKVFVGIDSYEDINLEKIDQNAYWSGWLKEIGKYIEAMHIKDFRLDENRQYCPTLLSEGVINYHAISEWIHKEHPDLCLLREEMNPEHAEDMAFMRKS